MNYCEYCGEKLDKSTPFCPYCGNSLNTPEHIKKYSDIKNNADILTDDIDVKESEKSSHDIKYDNKSEEFIQQTASSSDGEEDNDNSCDNNAESYITIEAPDEYTPGEDTELNEQIDTSDTEIASHEEAFTIADVNTDFHPFISPTKKRTPGAVVMGILGLVLGIISVLGTIYTFVSTIAVFSQHEKSAILQSFYFILIYGAPGITAIILSQRAIDNGFNGGVSKAAEITGSIGTFCHIGVFLISIIGIFI